MKDLASHYEPVPENKVGYLDTWDVVINEYKNTRSHDFVEEVSSVMSNRKDFGFKKHGVNLKPHNGRDSLVDAGQELLDTMVYLKNAIIEGRDEDGILQERMSDLYGIFEDIYLILVDEGDKEG